MKVPDNAPRSQIYFIALPIQFLQGLSLYGEHGDEGDLKFLRHSAGCAGCQFHRGTISFWLLVDHELKIHDFQGSHRSFVAMRGEAVLTQQIGRGCLAPVNDLKDAFGGKREPCTLASCLLLLRQALTTDQSSDWVAEDDTAGGEANACAR